MSAEFIAGNYTWTYNSKALGQTRDGFRMSHSFFKRLITGDLGGQTPQDAVYQGREQTSSFTLIEADKAGILDLIDPYAGTVGTPWTLGVIGLLDVQGAGGVSPVSRCKSLVGTAVSGTSAYTDMQVTITLPLSILREGFPVEVLLGPDLREVPIQMRHYPNMSTLLFGSNT
jgi:hypothetical protein